jgi:GTPase-associated protein 1, N-terminal domain type 2
VIEQAIFTSAKTERAQGYQLLSRSPGLAEADARELSVWGPSHGSLLEQPGPWASTNFFTLGSGALCVSRTTVAGAEYSGRGGQQVYTQFLVVAPSVLARFANNPFAILRAAAASGALNVHEAVPESLPAVQLAGRAPVVDLGLMAQFARQAGPAALATLIQAALASDQLAIYADANYEGLIAGLINALPVECRKEISFTTGLKFSPSRPVRVSTLPADESDWRALARRGITLLRLDGTSATEKPSFEGWAEWVFEVLKTGKLSVLAAELEQARAGLTCSDLPKLGEQLLANLKNPGHKPTAGGANGAAHGTAAKGAATGAATDKAPGGTTRQRADLAHRAAQFGLLTETRTKASHLEDLAEKLAEQPAEVLELLERIDDLVFDAISGDPKALAELEVLWPLATTQLDETLVEQSREQYLRCALSICSDFSESGVQRPERAVSAVDVLCVLFEE